MITFEEYGLARRQGVLLCIAAVPMAILIWALIVVMVGLA